MEGADLWAMLNPRSPRIIVNPRGYGSLSTTDLRLMLKDLGHGSMLMGLVFDAGDSGSLCQLRDFLSSRIAIMSELRRWQIHGARLSREEFWFTWANLILIEMSQENAGKVSKPCAACSGIGFTIELAQPELCDTCNGVRSARYTHQDRAELCDISLSNWKQSWAYRYFDMYDMANDWLLDARQHLKTRVRKFFNAA